MKGIVCSTWTHYLESCWPIYHQLTVFYSQNFSFWTYQWYSFPHTNGYNSTKHSTNGYNSTKHSIPWSPWAKGCYCGQCFPSVHFVWLLLNISYTFTQSSAIITLMAKCNTAVTPLLTHWSYCSLALSHRHDIAYSTTETKQSINTSMNSQKTHLISP